MENESYWYSPKMWWGLYYIYLGQFQTPALLVEGLLWLFLWMAMSEFPIDIARREYASFAVWIFFTKIMKLIPHFWRHPSDMKFIPLSILFSYVHGFMNVYAAFSMKQTQWGSQDLHRLERFRTLDSDDEEQPLMGTINEPENFIAPSTVRCPHNPHLFAHECLQCLLPGPHRERDLAALLA